jgi:hypothetical protein
MRDHAERGNDQSCGAQWQYLTHRITRMYDCFAADRRQASSYAFGRSGMHCRQQAAGSRQQANDDDRSHAPRGNAALDALRPR